MDENLQYLGKNMIICSRLETLFILRLLEQPQEIPEKLYMKQALQQLFIMNMIILTKIQIRVSRLSMVLL